jgi:spore germination cell wall hydrolase CwlJ-like protein
MIRILREAGISVAAVALGATATLAAPPAHARTLSAAAAPASDQNWFGSLLDALFGDSAESALPPAPPPPSLDQLVSRYQAPAIAGREQDCLANAVYFESRGEPIKGQLAVADVVLNRAASGRYPADLCDVVTQKAQFSFVRHGRIPGADRASEAWRKAVAIAHIAAEKLVEAVPADVLWYHAAYVAPSWRHRLTEESRIGLHIFYS